MLQGGFNGGLELRRSADGATRLRGRFPYGAVTVLWDGGRTGQARKEAIASRAFASRINADEDIHFLIGHSYDRPLASRRAGNLTVQDGDDALAFEATIGTELRSAPYVQDFLGALDAGLIRGLSPGFRVAPQDGAEDVRSDGAGLLRTVRHADLFEISAVTRPAYTEAQIEARNWQCDESGEGGRSSRHTAYRRWRA